MASTDKIAVDSFNTGIQYASTSTLSVDAMFETKACICAVKPEVLKSWRQSLEIDCSRALCLGADQKTCGLKEQDCAVQFSRLSLHRNSIFFSEAIKFNLLVHFEFCKHVKLFYT